MLIELFRSNVQHCFLFESFFKQFLYFLNLILKTSYVKFVLIVTASDNAVKD